MHYARHSYARITFGMVWVISKYISAISPRGTKWLCAAILRPLSRQLTNPIGSPLTSFQNLKPLQIGMPEKINSARIWISWKETDQKKTTEKRPTRYAWLVYFHKESWFPCCINMNPHHLVSHWVSHHTICVSLALRCSSSIPLLPLTLVSPDFPNLVRRRLCPSEWLQTPQSIEWFGKTNRLHVIIWHLFSIICFGVGGEFYFRTQYWIVLVIDVSGTEGSNRQQQTQIEF